MKRVLVVITTAFTTTGGLSTVMMNYYRAMDRKDLRIDFASSNQPPESLLNELKVNGSQYFKLPPRKNLPVYFWTLTHLSKGYDIMHVHGNSATAIIELLAAKMARIPKRIHHNHTSKTQHPFLSKILHPFFIYLVTDAVACSDAAGEWLFGKGKYTVLPNAIDIDKFKYNPVERNRIRQEFGIKDDEFVIGHIGKFMDAKNHEFLIKVFAKYHLKNPKSRLLLVGDGEWRPKIESWVANSGCPEAIILAGLRSDIPAIIQAFDIFVFPSVYEGLPLTTLEAQASGLPCIISSNVTKDVCIGRDVMMKDLSDGVDGWAEMLDKFDKSISREERCEENYKLITDDHFNIKREADELLNFYSL